MSEQLSAMRAKLQRAKAKRGELAKIAQASGITARTLYNLMNTDASPNLSTLDKLEKYFKREQRRATNAGQ